MDNNHVLTNTHSFRDGGGDFLFFPLEYLLFQAGGDFSIFLIRVFAFAEERRICRPPAVAAGSGKKDENIFPL